MNIVRCLLADSGLPKFLWGELMQTAVLLNNRSPHAALNNGAPYKVLYGKDDYLGQLRVMGPGRTCTTRRTPRSWSTALGRTRLVGYSMDSKSYRVYNAETRRVRESRNAIFIQPPSVMPPPDVGGYDDGEFTYDGHDMVRDVRNYTLNHSIDSLSSDYADGDPP